MTAAVRTDLEPFEVFVEAPETDVSSLPSELSELYGGPLGFPRRRLYVNFVSSLGGVTALTDRLESSHLIAAGSEHDRFLTVSPILVGRPTAGGRLSLLEGHDLLPDRTLAGRLLSLRRAGSHLFLRYELSRGAP